MKLISYQKRNTGLDFLKGIAIIAVVLYHFVGDVLPLGYLGVEIFFVISGYLLMKSMLRSIEDGKFCFFKQISYRILRLLPAVLAVSALCFVVGYIVMLPDDFENLVQSIIASSVFSNNILVAITTKNYWDVANLFKPLMHTWYLGVLVQAYVVIIGVTAICNKLGKNKYTVLKWLILLMTVVSFALYLTPSFSDAWKFYFLPFRLYEITIGSLIAFTTTGKTNNKTLAATLIRIMCVLAILVIIIVDFAVFPANIKLMMTVALTAIYTYLTIVSPSHSISFFKPLEFLGRNSFPIYISHQCIVAFFYYSFVYETTFIAFLIFMAVVSLFSLIVHYGIEKTTNHFFNLKKQKMMWIVCILSAVLICGASGMVYINAGVVRDVPELDISAENVYRGMHAAYCDIPYNWDKEFTDSDDIKVLVIGDSFGRDWANILNESKIADDIEISYIFPSGQDYNDKAIRRIEAADIVFCSTSTSRDISQFLYENVPQEKRWVVGYKNFGN